MSETKEKRLFVITEAQLISALIFIGGLAISFYIATKNYQSANDADKQIMKSEIYNNNLRALEDRAEMKQVLREIQAAQKSGK